MNQLKKEQEMLNMSSAGGSRLNGLARGHEDADKPQTGSAEIRGKPQKSKSESDRDSDLA